MVRRRRFAATLLALALLGAACGSDSSGGPIASGGPSEPVGDAPSAVEPTPEDAGSSETDTEVTAGTDDGASAATIRRTADGVPHIVAEDLGGLGFGYGYAFAEDQACSLIDMIVQVRSERARWHGAGPDDRYLHADLVYAALGIMDTAQTEYAALDPDLAQLVDGYAAGFDAYLDEVGPDGLNGWCAGAPWVGPITPVELVAYYKSLALRASIDPLIDYIAIATPPVTEASERGDDTATPNADSEDAWAELGAADSGLASNGWAIGPDRTADGTSMIVGNPHFPWEGALRFYEVQLTIPGRLDVYGASLLGVPVVNIGFNEHVAWSHTVSAGSRFTAYTLDLVEGDPTRYVYGDETREFEQRTASVEVLQNDDSISTVEQTLWFSHYGPVLDFPGIGWTNTTTLTLRDANADNDEIVEQWFLMNQATSMDELIDAHATAQGIPWVNTIAASAEGRIWYADTAATPNLSPEAVAAWLDRLESDPITGIAYQNRVVLLDGSDPLFEWVDDPEARDPGVVPFSAMPQLERTDYVFNANDPYWLANPDELITGVSPLHGLPEQPVSNRTRMNARQLDATTGDSGDDGVYTLEELRDSALANRVLTAELLADSVIERCDQTTEVDVDGETVDLAKACEVLAAWNRRVDLDSRGAVLWREFIGQFSGADLVDAGTLWAEPFDPADPVGTPSGLAADPVVLENLGRAVLVLDAAGLALDVPLGEVQFADRGGVIVPIHGGRQDEGVTNIVTSATNGTTTEPTGPLDAPVEGSASLRPDGYPITYGTSFIYALEFTADGPVAYDLLTYGHTGDPTDPAFSAETQRFSAKDWRQVLFTDAAIGADPGLVTYDVG